MNIRTVTAMTTSHFKSTRSKKRGAAIAAALLAGSTLGLASAGEASASTWNGCTVEGGHFCAFALLNYGKADGWGEWIGNGPDWPASIDEEDSSVVNLSYNYRVKVYDGSGYAGGTLYCVPRNTSYPNLNAQYGVYDDGGSHTFNSSC